MKKEKSGEEYVVYLKMNAFVFFLIIKNKMYNV